MFPHPHSISPPYPLPSHQPARGRESRTRQSPPLSLPSLTASVPGLPSGPEPERRLLPSSLLALPLTPLLPRLFFISSSFLCLHYSLFFPSVSPFIKHAMILTRKQQVRHILSSWGRFYVCCLNIEMWARRIACPCSPRSLTALTPGGSAACGLVCGLL